MLLRESVSHETPNALMLRPHWPPGNFQTKCHALGILLNNCSCFSLFPSLSLSSTCLSPPVPSHAIGLESQARNLLLWIRWSLLAGGSSFEPQLCDSSDALATELLICECLERAARPISLSTLKTSNISC